MQIKGISRPLIGVAVAVTLLAGACSSESATLTEASDNDVESSADGGTQPSDDEATSQTEAPQPETSDQPAETDEETAAPASHLFPNLNTVNIADGTTVNLADELAGGDTPVLLWFWAPH